MRRDGYNAARVGDGGRIGIESGDRSCNVKLELINAVGKEEETSSVAEREPIGLLFRPDRRVNSGL